MKLSDNIDRPWLIITGFTSHRLCFLESLFRLFTQGCRITMLESIQLVIAWLHNLLNDFGDIKLPNTNSTTRIGEMELMTISRKSVKAFKIDSKFIYDTEEDEYDVGAGEAAKTNDDNKLFRDLAKAIRESKDVLDGLLSIVMEDDIAKSLSAWFVQICGLQVEIASVHLAFNGLYVAILQGKLKFPSSLATLGDFSDTLSSMLLFVSKLEKCAIDIKSAIEQLENRRNSIGFIFNRARPAIKGHERSEWMRPTWYSPPRQQQAKSQLPLSLFGREAY